MFRPGRGKTEAMGCGFTPKTKLSIQGQDIHWGEDIVSMGVTIDRGLNFEAHLSEMRRKSVAALPIIATISHLAGLSWEEHVRAVPVRVETKACQGAEFTILNQNAPSRLNEMQRTWGAALFDVYPGTGQQNTRGVWLLYSRCDEQGWSSGVRSVQAAAVL